ncbi:MAG: COX15/CtaA family protein [Burkholderiaceae bacterium]
MNPTDRRLLLLRRLAGVCVALLLAVTSLSAYLRLSQAGLGCADWPRCYGQSLRELQQGVPVSAEEQVATAGVRLVHRVVATLALLLVVTMVMVCLGTQPLLRREGGITLALLGLALFLTVLGLWSSAARLPAVTMGNLLGGFAMLALCTRLAVAGTPLRAPGLRLWVVIAALLLIAQIALGSLVSSSYAALSCSGWSDCMNAARGVGWDTLNPWREPQFNALPPINPDGALALALHRGLGITLAALVVPLALAAFRRGRPSSAAALLVLFAAQVVVGLTMTVESLQLQFALLHNLLAAALLAALVVLF